MKNEFSVLSKWIVRQKLGLQKHSPKIAFSYFFTYFGNSTKAILYPVWFFSKWKLKNIYTRACYVSWSQEVKNVIVIQYTFWSTLSSPPFLLDMSNRCKKTFPSRLQVFFSSFWEILYLRQYYYMTMIRSLSVVLLLFRNNPSQERYKYLYYL